MYRFDLYMNGITLWTINWINYPCMEIFWYNHEFIQSKSLKHTFLHLHRHTYTAQPTSRCCLVTVKFSFICVANLSQFPTESLTPILSGHWHLSPPILTHSFLLATVCQTPAITTSLPTRLPSSVIGRYWDGSTFSQWQIRVGLSWAMRPCSGLADQLRMVLERRDESSTMEAHNDTLHDIIQQHKVYGVPTQAVSSVVMYHLCHHCVAFSWNVLTEALVWILTDSHTFTGF